MDAEQALIGIVLLDGAAFSKLAALEPEDFRGAFNRQIFESMRALDGAGVKIDPLTVASDLDRLGLLKNVGGRLALQTLAEQAVSSVDADYFVRQVLESSLKRKLSLIGASLSEDEADPTKGVGDLLEALECAITETRKRYQNETKARSAGEVTEESIKTLLSLYDGKATLGTPTGFHYLDEITMGWLPGMTYCVTATSPGLGKSAFVMQSAREATKHGHVLYVSGEMKRFYVWLREISSRSGTPLNTIRGGSYRTDAERNEAGDAMDQFKLANMHILDKRGPSVAEIMGEVRRLQGLGPVSLVVVDMVQHVKGQGDDKWAQIENAVSGMSDIAERFHVPVLYVSRANRKEINEGIPSLATPYGASQVESDAVALFGLCKLDDYVAMKQRRMAKRDNNGKAAIPTPEQVWNKLGWQVPGENAVVLMTLKNRGGAQTDIPLNFDGRSFTFTEVPDLEDARAEAEARNQRYRKGERDENY